MTRAAARPKAAVSWSGGKDSCLALMRAQASFDLALLVTMVDETGTRSRSHGQSLDVVRAQAGRLGLQLVAEPCSWETYEEAFGRALAKAAAGGVTHVVFGDILYDEHRSWAERICEAAGLTAVEPLFGERTSAIAREFLDRQGRAVIVTARQEALDASWLGRELSSTLVGELEALGVDPCGERGEYHTIVLDCPAFSRPLPARHGRRVESGGCWALELLV